jgi:hypothetical protein
VKSEEREATDILSTWLEVKIVFNEIFLELGITLTQ